jgi:hypothetical protein
MPMFLRFSLMAAAAAAVSLLAACAHADKPVEWRLQVRTAQDWPDLQALAQRVSEVGGVAVKPDVAGIAPRWYALTLQCENRAACKHATMKLATQPSLFVELRRDDQHKLPNRPTASNSQ